jgi:hypothetical protein
MPEIKNINVEPVKKNKKDPIIINKKTNVPKIENYNIKFVNIEQELDLLPIKNNTGIIKGKFFYSSNIGKLKQNHLFEFHPLILEVEFKKEVIKIKTTIIKNKRYKRLKKGKNVFQLYEDTNKRFSFNNISTIFDPESSSICNIIVNKNSENEFVSYGEAGAWNLTNNKPERKGIPLISSPHGLLINGEYTTINTFQHMFRKGCNYSISNGKQEKYFKLSNNQYSHMHDFYVTEKYIIINCSIMTLKGSLFSTIFSPSFTNSVDMNETTNNIYLFFDKKSFEIKKAFEIPNDNFYVAHQEYAFEESNNKVIIYRQVSENPEYSPYILASLENLKRKSPRAGKQTLEKLTFDLQKSKVEIQPYDFGSGFMSINQNFMKISKKSKKGLQYLYFNHMIISNNSECIVCLDIHNNKQIGIWKKKGYYVGEPQILPEKSNSTNEKKVKVVFVSINRDSNDSYLTICNYRLKQLHNIQLGIKLNMGIHSNFFFE